MLLVYALTNHEMLLVYATITTVLPGILHDGVIDSKQSMDAIANVAYVYAKAGAHVVAPSDMMDCRIGSIKILLVVSMKYLLWK